MSENTDMWVKGQSQRLSISMWQTSRFVVSSSGFSRSERAKAWSNILQAKARTPYRRRGFSIFDFPIFVRKSFDHER